MELQRKSGIIYHFCILFLFTFVSFYCLFQRLNAEKEWMDVIDIINNSKNNNKNNHNDNNEDKCDSKVFLYIYRLPAIYGVGN